MNRIIAGLALAGAIVSTAPTAHAGPYTSPYLGPDHYVSDLTQAGVPLGTPAQMTYVGQLICGNLANGMTTTAAATRLITAGLSTDMAVAIVGLAVIDMCPAFYPPLSSSGPAQHTPVVAPSAPSTPVPVTIVRALA